MAQNQEESQARTSQFDIALAIHNAGVSLAEMVKEQLDPSETNEWQELVLSCAAGGCDRNRDDGGVFKATVGYDRNRGRGDGQPYWMPNTFRIQREGKKSLLVEKLRIVVKEPVLEDGRLNLVCNTHAKAIIDSEGHSALESTFWVLTWLEQIELVGVEQARADFDEKEAFRQEKRKERQDVRRQVSDIVQNTVVCMDCGRKIDMRNAYGVNLREMRIYVPTIEKEEQRAVAEAILAKFQQGGGAGSLPLFVCNEKSGKRDETCLEGLQRALTSNPSHNWKEVDGERLYLTAPAPSIIERMVRSRLSANRDKERTQRALGKWGDLCGDALQNCDDDRGRGRGHGQRGGGSGRNRARGKAMPGI